MIPIWVQGVLGAAKAPPFRYKQTSVTFVNSGSATYDGSGYVNTMTTTNDRFGDSCTANFTADRTDVIAFSWRIRRSTVNNTATYLMYQGAGSIVNFTYSPSASTVSFGGTWPVTFTANQLDVKVVLNFTAKTATLYVADTLGGAKRLVTTTPFITNNLTSRAVRLYLTGDTAQLTGIVAYDQNI
jgi:hypothetical protein